MFLPIGHDQTVRRFPYVTLAIMVVCALLQILRSVFAPSEDELAAGAKRILDVEKQILVAQWSGIAGHRNPTEFNESYSDEPGARPAASASGTPAPRPTPEEPETPGLPSALHAPEPATDPGQVVRDFESGKIGAANDPLREELRAAKSALVELRRRDLVERFGYRANEPLSPNALFAAFLHLGWIHLISNMLFLWLCGMNMEDRWGHPVFAAFYALAAIGASLAFALVHRGTNGLAVGASGAIAGAMGAFLVDYHQARLKILYWPWWRASFLQPKTFFVRALFALPIWFVGELVDAWIESDSKVSGGTGYSAHVGGFVFGFAAALAMRYSGADARLAWKDDDDDPSEDDAEEAELVKARAAAQQDPGAAIAALRTMLVKHPDRIRARRLLLELALARGDASAIATSASAVLSHLGENGEWPALAQLFREVEEKAPRAALTDRALAMATRAGVCAGDTDLTLRAARRLVDAFPTSPLLRGTLWDVGTLQARAGASVLSADTLRRLHAAPPSPA
jgi:membrane associated rhomboid family serine protease